MGAGFLARRAVKSTLPGAGRPLNRQLMADADPEKLAERLRAALARVEAAAGRLEARGGELDARNAAMRREVAAAVAAIDALLTED
jgi:hypothetical protein